MQIAIKTNILTDGSKTHDVVLTQDGQTITLPAYGKPYAEELIDTLARAVDTMTAEIVVRL